MHTRRALLVVELMWLGACSVPSADQPVDRPVTADPRTPWGTVVGTVVAEDGTPLPGARAVVVPHGHEGVADDGGVFEIVRLDPGQYDLLVVAQGYGSSWTLAVAVATDSPTAVDVVLPPLDEGHGALTVRVLDALGATLPGAIVSVDGDEQTTGPDGTAVFPDLGGQTVDVGIYEPSGRMWPRSRPGLTVPDQGGLQTTVQLPGSPPPDSTYVGSQLCGFCHADVYAGWLGTGHAKALTAGLPADLLASFEAGASVDLPDGTVQLAAVAGTPWVTIEAAGGEARSWEVTGLIGDPSRGSVFLTEIGDQAYPLPVGWSGGDPDRPGWPDTLPRLVAWQPQTWLDGAGGFAFASRPDPSLSADTRCFACHATGFDLSLRADGGVDLTATEGDGRWLEADIGCERCHGPGSGHAMAFPADKAATITRPDRLDIDRANEVCTQCHAMTEGIGTGLPYPHAAGGPFGPGEVLADFATSTPDLWPNGSARGTRSQGDELARGLHGTGGLYRLACFDCHDPHGHGRDAADAPLADDLRLDARDNSLCVACHDALTFDDGATTADHPAHGGYDPGGTMMEGRCVGCHMPATASALVWHETGGGGDLASHRFAISPPTDALDAFDDLGATTLEVGEFPAHACLECHAWGRWVADQAGESYFGPTGNPTRRTTHEALQTAFEGKFP